MTPASNRPGWPRHAASLLLYAALSLLFIDHGVALTDHVFGFESDSYQFVWFLAWFPWAVARHVNPLWSHLLWQPLGQSLMWITSVPLLGALALPLTLTLGPVLTFNLLVILAPVLSAWCMYLLCVRLGRAAASSLIAGFLFGFSSYEMAEAATLNLSFTFLLPCIGLIVAARLQGALGRRGAVALITLVGVCQFLISSEIFALLLLFAAGTWLLAFAPLPAGLLACLVIAPRPFRTFDLPLAHFFAPGRESQVLGPQKQLLILPFAYAGPSSYWQVESEFSFAQTGGYLGYLPRAMQHFSAIRELLGEPGTVLTAADLADFAQATKTDYIVAGPETSADTMDVLQDLHWPERQVDDVKILDMPPAVTPVPGGDAN